MSEISEPFVQHSGTTGYFIVDPQNELDEQTILEYGNGVALLQNGLITFSDGQSQEISYTLLGVDQMSRDQILEHLADLSGFMPIMNRNG